MIHLIVSLIVSLLWIYFYVGGLHKCLFLLLAVKSFSLFCQFNHLFLYRAYISAFSHLRLFSVFAKCYQFSAMCSAWLNLYKFLNHVCLPCIYFLKALKCHFPKDCVISTYYALFCSVNRCMVYLYGETFVEQGEILMLQKNCNYLIYYTFLVVYRG